MYWFQEDLGGFRILNHLPNKTNRSKICWLIDPKANDLLRYNTIIK